MLLAICYMLHATSYMLSAIHCMPCVICHMLYVTSQVSLLYVIMQTHIFQVWMLISTEIADRGDLLHSHCSPWSFAVCSIPGLKHCKGHNCTTLESAQLSIVWVWCCRVHVVWQHTWDAKEFGKLQATSHYSMVQRFLMRADETRAHSHAGATVDCQRIKW